MSLLLRTDFGYTEVVIDEGYGLKKFYEVAGILSDNPDIHIHKKTDESDSLIWEFLFKKQKLILHYNIYTGIAIYPQKFRQAVKIENQAVVELARFLEPKLMKSC